MENYIVLKDKKLITTIQIDIGTTMKEHKILKVKKLILQKVDKDHKDPNKKILKRKCHCKNIMHFHQK